MSDVASENTTTPEDSALPGQPAGSTDQLEHSTYEIIRNRLAHSARQLQSRLDLLNQERRRVFGSIATELLATDRITTPHNCVPRDMYAVGNRFLFGFNVHLGLKTETELADVFAVFRFEDLDFKEDELELLSDPNFLHDFQQLYKYYRDTRFSKFHVVGPHVYMVFQIGKDATQIKAFKWLVHEGALKYVDNRSEHEAVFPSQYAYRWQRTHRDLHRSGPHPHISIEDRVFVETVGGDLTIKIEDNTQDGQGIYREPVDDPDQTLDDAEVFYSVVGNIILLKIRPFKEEEFRYFVYNEKIQRAMRLDALRDSCILLPEDHGLIFSNGYYLQTGEYKTFETQVTGLLFERKIAAPNGEDFLYVFYNREHGTYVLLMYNMIEQHVATPIICHGFSLFGNGQLVYFKSEGAPQKHHVLQIWQTPYLATEAPPTVATDSYLFKIGNRDIVRGMAECHEIIALIGQDESFADLYLDLVNKAGDVLDSYFWINNDQAQNLGEVLTEIRETSLAAVDEYEKVKRIRSNTAQQTQETTQSAHDIISQANRRMYRNIDEYVDSLSNLRRVRGHVVALRDLKYADVPAIDSLEQEIQQNSDRLSRNCVQFLMRDDALNPYVIRVQQQAAQIDSQETVAQSRKLGDELAAGAKELEMLIDIVSNLKIDDATQRTQIIDNISAIYSNLNQTRAKLKKKTRALMSIEGAAEFSSQLKLLGQAIVNYLDVCDTPARCDEYLTKMMVQVEELEGRFAEFDEFIVQLADKRDEIYSAFDAKKLQLVEERNRRATSLAGAADRILKGIARRLGNLESVEEIHSYFASDMMVEKVRDIVRQLEELDESVKVDDIQSRLKTIREDAVRQLHDKLELYVDGKNVIQLGRHRFNVNVQPLDLTCVIKDEKIFFHLTGTNYFEQIDTPELNADRHLWDQHLVSENTDVYRGEYLAWLISRGAAREELDDAETLLSLEQPELVAKVQSFMSTRYAEGYIKGVHDHDAALILRELLDLQFHLGLLKYTPAARALALIFWKSTDAGADKTKLETRIRSLGTALNLFGDPAARLQLIDELSLCIGPIQEQLRIGRPRDAKSAAGFLFDEISSGQQHAAGNAMELAGKFRASIKRRKKHESFESELADMTSLEEKFQLARHWLAAFVRHSNQNFDAGYVDEAAALLADESFENRTPLEGESLREITGMLGDHPRVRDGKYQLDFNEFVGRLHEFESIAVPAYEQFNQTKKQLLDRRREELRLEEFKPRVLTSFVRNRLIDSTYLPMIGDNLAKQIGVAGEAKRTDLMGLLLLISPPGYGKTTLMEYIANRLGLTFIKINGPTIGHQVTSLDPDEATNASARQEVERLNLALEMGDNVMIYLDDIQHCHPELLQKFISLCDATRKIEGVFKGRTRTYDLRGRKVCVVMAGNPYTESGEKFQIPDMLANRADTYNLGDVIGDRREAFELSYLENCLTSNPTLNQLHTRSRQDVETIIRMAAADARSSTLSLEGNFTVEEINEFVAVMQKLLRIRDIVLKVNHHYIDSAAQADDYRTEPAFKLQGSYRDMNKMAEQVMPIMNDQELDTLIVTHYENQAQTLTSDAQANLLKFRELMGNSTAEQQQRWNDIKRTFKRNLLLGSVQGDDKVAQVIAQMSTFAEGLNEIRTSIDHGIRHLAEQSQVDEENVIETATLRQIGQAVEQLSQFNDTLSEIKSLISARAEEAQAKPSKRPPTQQVQVINKVPHAFTNIIQSQFRILQTWMEPLLRLSESLPEAKNLKRAAELTQRQYEKMMKKLESAEDPPPITSQDETD